MTVVMELQGDWAEIANAVRAKLFPGEQIEHHAITKRKKNAP